MTPRAGRSLGTEIVCGPTPVSYTHLGFKEINKDDIKFVIIGGGPHFKDIKERVEKEGLKDKIIFTGIVPWEDIGLYYQLGDVFLNASISETQGRCV